MSTSRLHSVSSRPPLREGDLLTVDEVRRRLRISKALAYRLCTDGTIPSARIASVGRRRGRLVVRQGDVEAYVASLFVDHRKPAPILDIDAIHAGVRQRLRRAQGAPDG